MIDDIIFLRSDGSTATNAVYSGGATEDGESIFFEILDIIRPILNGSHKYPRILIRRVYPYMKREGE